MTATSGKGYAVGLRHARVYPLDANGRPAAVDENVYEGVQMVSAKAFDVNQAAARRVLHMGDDNIKAEDLLPPNEATESTLRVGRNDHDVHAIMTGGLNFTIGESAGIGYGTNLRGSEPDIAVLCYQIALDAVTKLRRYRNYMMPVSRGMIRASSMNENPAEWTYDLLTQIVSRHIWGVQFVVGVEGFIEAEILEFYSEDIPHVVSWIGDNSTTQFNFDTDRPATATTKIHVVTTTDTDGTVTDVTATVTKAVGSITFSVAPASGVNITCYYEYAD